MAGRRDPIDLRTYVDADDVLARGRRLREQLPEAAHDHRAAGPSRPDVLEYIEASNVDRLPELIPLRIGRMTASPFSFFRGAAGLMAADLAGTPDSGLTAQLCGDAHAANFGLYGTPDGQIVMDINDFDETIPGPWEWDLKRLSASLVLAGREGGVSETGCHDAAQDAVKSYRKTMKKLAEVPFLRSWSALPDASILDQVKADALLGDFDEASEKARRNTSDKVVAKWTEHLEDHHTGIKQHRFTTDPPVLTRVDATIADGVIDGLTTYVDTLRESRRNLISRFAVSDVAFRIVGTGSVGLRSYVVLLHGNHSEDLVLQVKQAKGSALAPFVSADTPRHEGKRIVRGARMVQSETDILLGWTTIDGLPYIVRQFRNLKGDIDPTSLRRSLLDDYGRLAGALLARAHARSLDPRLLAGYLSDGKGLDKDVADFAIRYADQTEQDFEVLAAAVAAGTIEAQVG